MTEEKMFARGILSLSDAAAAAHRAPRTFRRHALQGRLPFRVRRDKNEWLVDGGSFQDWLNAPQQEQREKQ